MGLCISTSFCLRLHPLSFFLRFCFCVLFYSTRRLSGRVFTLVCHLNLLTRSTTPSPTPRLAPARTPAFLQKNTKRPPAPTLAHSPETRVLLAQAQARASPSAQDKMLFSQSNTVAFSALSSTGAAPAPAKPDAPISLTQHKGGCNLPASIHCIHARGMPTCHVFLPRAPLRDVA